MGSLQRRLDAGLIVSLVLFFLIQWAAVSGFIQSLTKDQASARLRQDSESLLAALHWKQAALEPELDSERIAPIYKRPFSGRYFQIETGRNTLRSRSLWDQTLSFPQASVGKTVETRASGPQGQNLLLLISGYHKQNQILTIAVAEDLSGIEAEIHTFQFRYALLSMVILILLIFMQRKIVRGGLAPLAQGRQDMDALERGEIKHLSETVPDEVKPFVKEINRLLEGMTQRLQRSRNAMGNLAHALKGPLTLLTQLSDRSEIKAHPPLRQEMTMQTDLLRHLLDRELKRARLAGAAQPVERLNFQTEIAALCDSLKKIHREKTLNLTWIIPPGFSAAFDREDLLELLGNLLDNACKWAKTDVVLQVKREDGMTVSFSVEDDGPGTPKEFLERLTHRGVRVDEATGGHGLGLAIVQDIVAQYGGEIRFGRSNQLGGFHVLVTLPCKTMA